MEKVSGVKLPRNVVEVGLEPKLKMVYVRFKKPSKGEFGEPIYPGIHLFSEGDAGEITAVEIVDFDRFEER